MYDWSDLRYFLAVHREGTLAAAGRELRVDPTTVGRRISALEGQLRTRLFIRGSRGWVTTPAGLRIVPAAQLAEEAALDVHRLASGASDQPSGRVRLTTIEILASQLIAPALPQLHEAYPDIRIDLWCSPMPLDLAKGEAELALRVGRPTDPNLLARRLSTVKSRPYAAQTWLDANGLEPELTSLRDREVLFLLGPRKWNHDLGRVQPVLRSTEISVLLEACTAGLGVALLPDELAARRPELVPLNGLGEPIADPVWLAVHRDLAEVARVRAVTDFLVELLTHVH